MRTRHETLFVLNAKDKTKTTFQKTQVRLKSLGKSVSLLRVGFAGLAGATGIGLLTKSSINAADEISKLSQRLGASTEALSEYKHVAEISGVEFKVLTKGWQNMADKISDAAKGTGEAKEALIDLGLSALDLNRLKPDEQFEAIAEAMLGIVNQGDKVRIAMDLFGGRGVSLLQAMTEGADGIRRLKEEADTLGITLSKEDAFGAASANDAMARLSATTSALSITLGRELQGPIEEIADKLTEAALASGGFQTEIKSAVKGGLGALATMVEATDSVINYFDSREGLATAGVIGYILLGKKGIAAVAAAQLVIDATANALKGMNDVFADTSSVVVDTSQIENARRRLVELSDKYNNSVEMGFDGQVEGARSVAALVLADLNAQVMKVTGMELMLISQKKMTNQWTESKGLLGGIAEALRAAQMSVDDIQGKTKEGLIGGGDSGSALIPDNGDTETVGLPVDDNLQKRFNLLAGVLKTEEQVIAESYLARQQILIDAEMAGIESVRPFDELKLTLAKQHEEQITEVVRKGLSDREKFTIMSAKNQTKTVVGEMVALTQGVAQHNKTLFEVNKAAGVANALIGAYEGFNRTMGAYPYPYNIGLAGLSLAASLAQVNAIRSTSFVGGGAASAPSLAGTGGGAGTINTIPISPVDAATSQVPPTEVNVTITGGVHDSNAVRELIEAINEEVGDGVKLNATIT